MFTLSTRIKLLTIPFLLLIPLTHSYAVNLLINEIYPAPNSGEFEWIEIYNYGEDSITKDKITILDASGNKLALNFEVINPKEYALATSSSKLNNDGDSIFIYYQGIENPVALVTYSASTKGKSLSLCPDADPSGSYLQETDPTPNAENNCPVNTPTPTPTTSSPTESNLTPSITPTISSTPTTNLPSPTNTPTPTPTLTKSPDQTYYIQLSEVYPNPNTGELEWVELYNPYNFEINLEDYLIDDIEGGSSPIIFSVQIQPKKYFVLEIQKSIFNNTADSVRILSPTGELIDSFSYTNTQKGKSWAKDKNGKFCLQDPTKGTENPTCPEESEEDTTEKTNSQEPTPISSKLSKPSLKTNTAQIRLIPKQTVTQLSYTTKLNSKKKDILGIETTIKVNDSKEERNSDNNKKTFSLTLLTNANIFVLYVFKKLTEILQN